MLVEIAEKIFDHLYALCIRLLLVSSRILLFQQSAAYLISVNVNYWSLILINH